jgi:hypothetical protein
MGGVPFPFLGEDLGGGQDPKNDWKKPDIGARSEIIGE